MGLGARVSTCFNLVCTRCTMYDFCMIAWRSLIWHFVRVGFGVCLEWTPGSCLCTVSGMDLRYGTSAVVQSLVPIVKS